MAALLHLGDRERSDLATLVGRGARFGDGAIRLTASNDVLMVTVPLTASSGLFDLGPTILGMRASRMQQAAEFDTVVAADALGDALRSDAAIEVTNAVSMPAWASWTPPRDGWRLVALADAAAVRVGATAAAARIARELPEAAGEAVIRRVRRSVWSSELELYPCSLGVCVALEGLGFLGDEPVRLTTAGGWIRASTRLGDVLHR